VSRRAQRGDRRLRAAHDEADVGRHADEVEADRAVLRDRLGLARACRRLADALQRCTAWPSASITAGWVRLADVAHRGRQVGRADEQRVDAVDGAIASSCSTPAGFRSARWRRPGRWRS
jgi:hypothetical protein